MSAVYPSSSFVSDTSQCEDGIREVGSGDGVLGAGKLMEVRQVRVNRPPLWLHMYILVEVRVNVGLSRRQEDSFPPGKRV